MDRSEPVSTERLPLLDGLRGIAAFVVMYYHARHFALIDPLVPRGYLFVDFFFLLSGFVLGMTADPRLRSGMAPTKFLAKRIRRLWPLMAIGTLIGLAPYAMTGQLATALKVLPLALAMVPLLSITGLVFPLNSPVWSLTMELIANTVHALLLSRLNRAWLAAFVTLNGLLLFAAIVMHGYNELGATNDRWVQGIPRVLFSYGFGLLLARYRVRRNGLSRFAWPWWAAVVVPLVAICGLPYAPITGWVGDSLVTLAILPLSFAASIGARLPQRLIPLFRGLGLMSYPLYTVHLPLLLIASLVFTPSVGRIVGPAVALTLAAVLAAIFEVPRSRGATPAPTPKLSAADLGHV